MLLSSVWFLYSQKTPIKNWCMTTIWWCYWCHNSIQRPITNYELSLWLNTFQRGTVMSWLTFLKNKNDLRCDVFLPVSDSAEEKSCWRYHMEGFCHYSSGHYPLTTVCLSVTVPADWWFRWRFWAGLQRGHESFPPWTHRWCWGSCLLSGLHTHTCHNFSICWDI